MIFYTYYVLYCILLYPIIWEYISCHLEQHSRKMYIHIYVWRIGLWEYIVKLVLMIGICTYYYTLIQYAALWEYIRILMGIHDGRLWESIRGILRGKKSSRILVTEANSRIFFGDVGIFCGNLVDLYVFLGCYGGLMGSNRIYPLVMTVT